MGAHALPATALRRLPGAARVHCGNRLRGLSCPRAAGAAPPSPATAQGPGRVGCSAKYGRASVGQLPQAVRVNVCLRPATKKMWPRTRRRPAPPRRYPGSQLRPGYPAAQALRRLPLLPFGPGGVHRPRLARDPAFIAAYQGQAPSGTASGGSSARLWRIAGTGYRQPPA